jgi:hypothetical protein
MPRDALDDDIEADVREAYTDSAADHWAHAQERENERGRRAAEDSEKASEHFRREGEADKQRFREERRGDAGRDGWRSQKDPTLEDAPKYLTERAKEEWLEEKLMRSAYREVHGRAQEKADLERYHEEAAASGTTLRDALGRYTSFEKVLRADPLNGLAAIARNAGIDPRHAADYFTTMAGGDVLGFTRGGAAANLDRATAGAGQTMSDLQRTEHALDAAARHLPDFERHAEAIAQLFERGQVRRTGKPEQDLLDAYHQVTRAERAAGAKAQRASRSIAGSASGDAQAPPARRRTGNYDADLEADVREAYRQQAGGY